MGLENHNFFKRNLVEGDAILYIFKLIFISLTLIIGATSSQSGHLIQTSNSYIFAESLVKATEQLQDAISLILSSYSGSDYDIYTELAWKNCSVSILNGWGEIQDAVGHLIMEGPGDAETGNQEMARQMMAAEGFIESCVDDLENVESTAASEVRAKLLLAKVYLSGRGDFLSSRHYDEIWKLGSLRLMVDAWGVVLENLIYIIFCGLQLFYLLYILQKLLKFRST